MARERERPVRIAWPQRIECAADGSGVWLDNRLARWSEFRAVGYVTVPDLALVEQTYAVMQLRDGVHVWIWLEEGDEVPRAASEWLRSVVEPGLRLPESFAIDSWGYHSHVLWPPQEVGQALYEERPHRVLGWLWREPRRFARLH